MSQIAPCLWFDTQAEDAARFYASVFPNSRIGAITYYGEGLTMPAGTALTVEFELDGLPFIALNGGPTFKFTEAVSFQIDCRDQAEVDFYWEKLGKGGEPGPCGWLKDRFGLSWQVVPREFMAMIRDPDPAKVQRAMNAMMQMGKLDIAALRAAYDGV